MMPLRRGVDEIWCSPPQGEPRTPSEGPPSTWPESPAASSRAASSFLARREGWGLRERERSLAPLVGLVFLPILGFRIPIYRHDPALVLCLPPFPAIACRWELSPPPSAHRCWQPTSQVPAQRPQEGAGVPLPCLVPGTKLRMAAATLQQLYRRPG